ncbi:hypothetical protein RMATCC62417_18356 [Rhizopus microsporus]|nr:hypothetical protein RMATCC62417_18356 [Rhizopus microsporus]
MYHCHAIVNHRDHLDRFVGKPRSNVVVQLGGSDPDAMATAAKALQDYGYSEVNINAGCPSPNVQSGQFGAVLMKTPHIVADILSAMDKHHVRIPVTVKCRIGVDHQESFEFLYDFVKAIVHTQKGTLPHLILHARKCILKGLSPKQNRSIPPLNYKRVFEIAKSFPDLPISINGGFNDVSQIKEVLTKVDGCMIGRKIMDKPLFLQQLDQHVYNQSEVKSLEKIINEYLDYTDSLLSLSLDKADYGLPPFTLLLKPLMMLFDGKMGKNYRRLVDERRRQTKWTSPEDFRSIWARYQLPIASHPLVLRFFETKQRKNAKSPNASKEIFDIAILVNHVVAWDVTLLLDFLALQLKTILLLTIATMWRPCSDIDNLQFRDIAFIIVHETHTPTGVTLVARQPKEITAKTSKLGAIDD